MSTFADRNVLHDDKIGFADSRSAADRTRRSANAAKQARVVAAIDDSSPSRERLLGPDRLVAFSVKLFWLKKYILDCSVGAVFGTAQSGRMPGILEIIAVHQLVIGVGCQMDWKSGLVGCDPRDGPFVEHFPGEAAELSDWEIPVVADYKTMASIEQRERIVIWRRAADSIFLQNSRPRQSTC